MFDRIKKVTETIDNQRPKVIERVLGKEEKGPKPRIRKEYKFTSWNYFFNCGICGVEYGPKSTRIPEADGGIKIWQSHYMFCSDCTRFVCKPRCWNYIVGKCLTCAPSKEIEMKRMIPKIRSERKIPMWHYYFTCDICDIDYGPEKSMSKQADGGFKLTLKHFRQCPNCGKYLCRSRCWNYTKGTCTICNTLTPPEYTVKDEKMKKKYFFICSVCRQQFGPLSKVDWKKVKKIGMGTTKIALGVFNPALAVGGSYDIATGVKASSSPTKSTQEITTEVKADLAQCPSCSRWVCIDNCWNKTVGVCNNCSKE